MYQLSEHDHIPISSDHHWVYKNHSAAKCKYCGLKTEYAIYDVVCYGGPPVEKFKWTYFINERDEDIDPETCQVIILDRVTSFFKKIYSRIRMIY